MERVRVTFRRAVNSSAIWAFIVAPLLGLYSATCIIVRPGVVWDAGMGFLVWDGMRRGAPFNVLVEPDFTNLAVVSSRFVGWWSPGQYLVPGLLEAAGLSLGLAMAVVIVAAVLTGIAGWRALYLELGFRNEIVAIAITLVCLQTVINSEFLTYSGGEVLLFASAPWFCLLVRWQQDMTWRFIPLVLSGMLVLCFAKLTGIIWAIAVVGATALSMPVSRAGILLKRSFISCATGLIFGILFYVFWYLQGENPVRSGSAVPVFTQILAGSINSIWTALIPAESVLELVLGRPRPTPLHFDNVVQYIVLPVSVSICLFASRTLRRDHADYLSFATIAVALYLLIMLTLYMIGADISSESRHFRMPALLVWIGLVHALVATPTRSIRIATCATVTIFAIYSIATFALQAAALSSKPLGERGFRHDVDRAMLDYITAIDTAEFDGQPRILLFTTPSIGLVPKRIRLLEHPVDLQSVEELRDMTYTGRAGRIHILLQMTLVTDGRARVLLERFIDYSVADWKMIPLGTFTAFEQ